MQGFSVKHAALVSLMLVCGKAHASMLGTDVGPDEIGPVSISLNDNAAGACWTNLKEVREYAEEKLRIQGYELGEDSEVMLNYTLLINVDAFRSKAAPTCVGSIIVMLVKGSEENGIWGFHTINMENVVATSPPEGDLNKRVIEIVQTTIDAM